MMSHMLKKAFKTLIYAVKNTKDTTLTFTVQTRFVEDYNQVTKDLSLVISTLLLSTMTLKI